MNPLHGEVWLVDMGMTAKTRPALVLIADSLDAPRTLIIHVPIPGRTAGASWKCRWDICRFSNPSPSPMCRPSDRCPQFVSKSGSVWCRKMI